MKTTAQVQLLRLVLTAAMGLWSTHSFAQVSVSAETWFGDQDENTGYMTVYGTGYAEVDGLGVVTAKAFLNGPGGTLDSAQGATAPQSTANVDVSLHPDTAAGGNYTTVGEGWKDGQLYGCASYNVSVMPYVARYSRGGCSFGLCTYNQYSCSHACQGDAARVLWKLL